MRIVFLGVVVLAASAATPSAVYWTRAQGPAPEDLCADRYDTRRQHHCEVREEVIPASSALDIDPGHNGSVSVRGWQRSEVRLRTRIEGHAETDSRARELVSAVRVTAVNGRIRSDGVMTIGDEHWATSFHLDVPSNVNLAINARNGGISLEDFSGPALMRTVNGAITLRQVGGDIKGQTQNGALRIELTGARWEGTGLDVETRNGSIRLALPAKYSAELETGTVHGRVSIDFPVLIHSGRERRFTTTLGSGGSKIRAITTNGSVTVSTSF